MTRSKKLAALVTVVVVCICTAPLFAEPTDPCVWGTSTATKITEPGPRQDWYLYVIEFDWDLNTLGAGLSHWDVILKPDCGSLDHLIEFDTPAGISTCFNYEQMEWSGYFERGGDPANGVFDPVVKYNDPFDPCDAEPGPDGYGTFSFYANITPEYEGPYENTLMAKGGTIDPVYGDLTGAYPSCTIIPEPATILLLGLGGLALLRKR